MTKNCQYCKKSRVGLLYFFVGFIILNFAIRKYFGLSSFTLQEVLLLPSAATIFLAFCIIAIRYFLANYGLQVSKKRGD